MDAITYTTLRNNLKSYMDSVYQNKEPLIINRKKNQNVVLISIGDYNSLVETNYLLSSPKNARRLRESLKQVRKMKGKKKKLTQ